MSGESSSNLHLPDGPDFWADAYAQAEIDLSGRFEFVDEDLEDYKKRLGEISMTQAQMTDFGHLAQETGDHQWKGKISLDHRLASGEITMDEVNEFLELASGLYVPVTPGAPVRCIDPRTIEGYIDGDRTWFERPLGPQVPGGAPGGAISLRLALGDTISPISKSTLEEDLDEFTKTADRVGFAPGGHSDENAGQGRTGCAVVDQIDNTLNAFDPEQIRDLAFVTQRLLGDHAYHRSNMNVVVANSVWLRAYKDRYFKGKDDVFNKLRTENPHGNPRLVGVHPEIAVVINNVENTTLHTDHLNAISGGKLMLFNYDFWMTRATAAQLEGSAAMKSRYLHARTAVAVGTLMNITDGSQRLIIRNPSRQAA